MNADTSRGWDHGVFVPLILGFPQADVPIVQLSLMRDLEPKVSRRSSERTKQHGSHAGLSADNTPSRSAQAHIDMGVALAPLRDEGVLVLGSGSSFHNMTAIMQSFRAKDTSGAKRCQEFDEALQVCVLINTKRCARATESTCAEAVVINLFFTGR